MITPADIHNKEFEKGLRGYKTDDVDTFMAEVVREFETLYRDNRELTDKIEQLEKRLAQYEQMEATMNNTLVLAQETGENVKIAARKEASLIIQDAEQQRKALLEQAEKSLRDAHQRYELIRNDVAVFRAKMESILHSQLQLLVGVELPDKPVEEARVETPVVVSHVEEPVVEAVEETPVANEMEDTIVIVNEDKA